jgi:hypothetical protein
MPDSPHWGSSLAVGYRFLEGVMGLGLPRALAEWFFVSKLLPEVF